MSMFSNFSKKKFNKLIRNPKLFFLDLLFKRLYFLPNRFYVAKSVAGKNKFSIISAAYNVEKYLDDYFKSITKQTLDSKNIEIIIIDDGSTDKTPDIVKQWQKKYPLNIQYVRKENGGQASARNKGIQYARHEWVTYIDPDDFLRPNYFEEIDKAITNAKEDIALVSSNTIFYNERNKSFVNSHPLRYRFEKGNWIVNPFKNRKAIQFSASTAFFRKEDILKFNIEFNSSVKPNFEDGKFVCDYLLNSSCKNIMFLPKAVYYYRKRKDESSTLDSVWRQEAKYTSLPKLGYLSVLEEYRSALGYVPLFIQWTVLYDFTWYLKYLINRDERVNFLSKNDKALFIRQYQSIFTYIGKKEILDFNLAGCWFFHKVGMLSLFKCSEPQQQIIYVEELEQDKQLVKLRYFCKSEMLERFEVDGVPISPAYQKIISHKLLNEVFIHEKIVWLPVGGGEELQIFLDDQISRISFNGEQVVKLLFSYVRDTFGARTYIVHHSLSAVILKRIAKLSYFSSKYHDSWLFLDRDTQADDNAEHLYRYVSKNEKQINAYFILRRKSHDWGRLKNEGFKLIAFGSLHHKVALLNCQHLISSHADNYVVNYLNRRLYGDALKYKLTFLQHGLSVHDMSRWFNTKKFDCVVSSSPQEYQALIGDGGQYQLTQKEVVLSGFPRHDKLLEYGSKGDKTIVVMPTWREYLVGRTKGKSNSRVVKDDFMDSTYAKSWRSFLVSAQLRELIEKHKYRVIFFPHANIQPYLREFDIPKNIEVLSHSEIGIQELFKISTVLITDYSSVAYEMALMRKPVLYYQFDYDEFYSGSHVCKKGFFDYVDDGFGAVSYDEETLVNELSLVLDNNGVPTKKYYDRMVKLLPLVDGNNCSRTFEAIRSVAS
ncbi:hypothetical protein DS2_08400 [Catenovulum agarivorans DS-2]|uniref:Glycosyltransferase 2-like domain-containing protein n=1 Tax=Catenovulum agarivorans DS-2 TaxID=1328313 RepID=W7QED6_9ALTE|nr:CDP-glycerol glycerophosphotransferase family protein [Catenovulum agarivorans]EWH10281.1 hypothetical protein DS2_08400 [Catenovulum agarivorans DS-2]